MPRTCTVCRSKHADEINSALIAGEPLRNIARRFETSAAAVFRHGRDHIAALLAKAESQSEESAGTLVGEVRTLQRRMIAFMDEAQSVVDEAKESGDPRLRLAGIKEGVGAIRSMTPLLELRGRVSGELSEKPAQSSGVRVTILIPEQVEPGAPPSELMRYRQEQAIEEGARLGQIIDVEPIIRELEPGEFDSDGDDDDPDELESGELDSDE
jgi:hypothetical protein